MDSTKILIAVGVVAVVLIATYMYYKKPSFLKTKDDCVEDCVMKYHTPVINYCANLYSGYEPKNSQEYQVVLGQCAKGLFTSDYASARLAECSKCA